MTLMSFSEPKVIITQVNMYHVLKQPRISFIKGHEKLSSTKTH